MKQVFNPISCKFDYVVDTVAELSDEANYLLCAGTRPLTGLWDAGSWQIRAETFRSDIATGTAPLTIASTTVCTNLNADMLDGKHTGTSGNTVPLLDGNNTYSGTSLFTNAVTTGLRGRGVTVQCFGNADDNLFWVVPTTDRIGIGTNAPTAYLHQKASTATCATGIIPAGTAPNAPNEGDYWNDSTQKASMHFVDGIKQSRVGCIFTQYEAVTVASTNAETTLVGTGIGTTTLPANFFTVGKTIRLTASGYYSTNTTLAQTLTMRVRYSGIAGTPLITTSAIGTSLPMTNRGWRLMTEFTCWSTGAGGGGVGQGTFMRSTSTSASEVWDMVVAGVSLALI
jgi:hypothetical protein